MDYDTSLIPTHGGYRKTTQFPERPAGIRPDDCFLRPLHRQASRTHDQMVQAARSGCKHRRGSMASATSKKQNSS